MNYREPLPTECPPADAQEIKEPLEVFRAVRGLPPTENDFDSQRKEKPTAKFSGVSECQALGLSVFTQLSDCEKALKLPSLRGRKICKVSLIAGAGRIKQTSVPSHHTWWPFASFQVLSHCKEIYI